MPSTIPRTREELLEGVTGNYEKLAADLEEGGAALGSLVCVDDWTVKQLLAVRAWWSEAVARWVREGREGAALDLPAPGYTWKETPRLNGEIAKRARRESYSGVKRRLHDAQADVLRLIDELSDRELCDAGIFAWAGKYPICRWIALNTSRQYATARTHVRRALRELR